MKKREKREKSSIPKPDDERFIKEKLEQVHRRKRANRVIRNFLKQFPNKSLIQILPVLIRRCSDIFVAKVAIERIERNQKEKLSFDDRMYLKKIKSFLKPKEETLC